MSKKGLVYRVSDDDFEYTGSTILTIERKIGELLSQCKRWLNDKTKYICAIPIVARGRGNFNIEILEEGIDERDLTTREQFWIDESDARGVSLNLNTAKARYNRISKARQRLLKKAQRLSNLITPKVKSECL
jgi:hypothetical protein